MNIGFHIPRDNYIKLFAPLMDHLLAKGCQVTAFCDYRKKPAELGYKSYAFPAVEKLPKFRFDLDIAKFHDLSEFGQLIQKKKMQVLFFVNFDAICKELKILLEGKHPFISAELQYFLELFSSCKDLSYTDVIYLYSDNWKEWWKEYLRHHKIENGDELHRFIQKSEEKCVSVGFPEADQCADFETRSLREKYGIPEGKKVLLLFPFPWRLPFSIWTHVIYQPQPYILKLLRLVLNRAFGYFPDLKKGIHDLKLTETIRRFADKNDAYFVVKGRLKNRIPGYLKKLADKVFLDESFYPFTTLELLHIADLSISFYSAVIMESVLAQTPALCLSPKRDMFWPGYDDRHFMPAFSPSPGSFYNFDGAVYYETVGDFISSFHRKTFEDFKPIQEKMGEFIHKFFGYKDRNASGRIYEDLVRRTL